MFRMSRCWIFGLILAGSAWLSPSARAADPKTPNIIWIVTEDISPNLGCYGDPDAITPNIDKLAARGAKFTRAFSHSPVCAPTRSGLISGMYPTTMGSHHMRSTLLNPPKTFPEELRDLGYFVAWPGKTDFNFAVPKGLADTKEDWTKKPEVLPKDKPFFAYINYTITHESQNRVPEARYKKNTERLKPEEIRDRSKLQLPPYYPDHPDVRECLGKYHDHITALDYLVGDILELMDKQGWADNTIVVFYGDHGIGLPRGKRWCYDTGILVPMLISWPAVIEPNSVREDKICFLDLAPSMIAVAGGKPPERMQGRVIIGEKTDPEPDYIFSARDRMDEAYDRIRSVRGDRYHYIRNFHPEIPYAQWINYRDMMPVMKVWRKQAFAGELNDVQSLFFARTKPKEEFYDTLADPWEVKNLIDDPAHQETIGKMRKALDEWIVESKDKGEIPELELIKQGLVQDRLTTEYAERLKQHPKTSPVP